MPALQNSSKSGSFQTSHTLMPLLRDDVVIHDGTLKSLRRFKDEVREVQQGYECGMAFENYQDIQVGDRIECYEIQEVARTL